MTDTITVDRFGGDHYSTLAYLEVRAVDHRGRIDHEHMRCDYDRHPALFERKKATIARETMAGLMSRSNTGSLVLAPGSIFTKRHPTRLGDGAEQYGHDDYDCILDLIAAGWLTADTEDPLDPDAVYRITDYGWTVVADLRKHKGGGGSFKNFRAFADLTPAGTEQ